MSSKKKSPLRQLTLNFGQRPVRSNQCKECGMVYNLNDKQDEHLHFKYHHDKDKVLNYIPIKNEKIIKDYFDGKCVVIQWGIDQKQAINKAVQILNYVDSQLGINETINSSFTNDLNDSINLSNGSLSIKNLSKFYFYISNLTKKIDGFCFAEPIDHAHRLLYLNGSESSFSFDETKIERAYCGIARIWVSSSMRRKGIATKLLECVCDNFLYIRKLEPNQIAFSDPTEFGRCLATSFTKSNSFLIYNNSRKN